MKLKMRKSVKITIGIVSFVFIIIAGVLLWKHCSYKPVSLEIEMCDENGNVIHVSVDGGLRYQWKKLAWNESWKFEGEVCFDGKVFTTGSYYYPEMLVPLEWKDEFRFPPEWVNCFRFLEWEGETYYWMSYQNPEEAASPSDLSTCGRNYYGPSTSEEESERIIRILHELFVK